VLDLEDWSGALEKLLQESETSPSASSESSDFQHLQPVQWFQWCAIFLMYPARYCNDIKGFHSIGICWMISQCRWMIPVLSVGLRGREVLCFSVSQRVIDDINWHRYGKVLSIS
jgi:hypothetical protein